MTLYTINDLREKLQLNDNQSVYRWIKAKRVPHVRLGKKKGIRVSESAFNAAVGA